MDLDKLREKISCPQFKDKDYGEWDNLKLEQRIAIRDLIELSKTQQKTNEELTNEIINLNNMVEVLKEELINVYTWEYAYTEEEALRRIRELKEDIPKKKIKEM